MKIRFLAVIVGGLVGLAGLAGCANQLSDTLIQHLDRPVDVAFACVVGLIDENNVQSVKAVPTSECGPGGNVLPGTGSVQNPDGGLQSKSPLAFIVEGVRGDVSISNLAQAGSFVDSDPFAPGLNGVPVGRLPIGITTSSDGCYTTVANSGSCDLATVDVVKGLQAKPDAVTQITIRSATGPLDARPSAIAAPPSLPISSVAFDNDLCTSVTGTVYVAFPRCHLVARIDVASGMVLDGIQFHDGAPPELVGGDVTCPSECQGGDTTSTTPDASTSGADGGVGGTLLAPGTVTFEPDGSRLYVGGLNSPNVYIVDLDSDFKATAVQAVPLEGAGGVRRISATGDVNMSTSVDVTINFRFLYVIGNDNTIHVVNVRRSFTPVECDTQLDRRFLHDLSNQAQTACFPVGATGFPRRVDATGPGIKLPNTVVPLDVGFFSAAQGVGADGRPTAEAKSDVSPTTFNGTFAMISTLGPVLDPTLGRGMAYFVTVKDQTYPASETDDFPLGDPRRKDIALALPHTPRDANASRFVTSPDPCFPPSTTPTTGATRISGTPIRTTIYFYNDNVVNVDPDAGVAYAPSLHRAACATDAGTVTRADWENAMGAPPAVRASLFPDLEKSGSPTALSGSISNEQIIVSWEGPLTPAIEDSHKSGAHVEIESGGFTVASPGALLCNLGVQIGDIMALIGCQTDRDCGAGEICVTHPDAPSTVSGMCLPSARRDELLSACAPLLTTRRKYTVVEAADDHTIVVPRPATLFASPIDGCSSDQQCQDIEKVFIGDALAAHNYHCESDPAGGGVAQCVVACGRADDIPCDEGSICDPGADPANGTGHCILGPIVFDSSCLQPLQNYEYRGGSAFTLVSTQDEFGSRQKVDPQSGLCVPDETKGPLVIQRFHRLEAPCTDLSISATTPNPCSLTLMEPADLPAGGTVLRETYGIRIRTVGVTFDITDVAQPLLPIPGVRFSPIFDDYTMNFSLSAGFTPLNTLLTAPLPERIRVAPDTTMWFVDSGDDSANFSTGQLVPLFQGAPPFQVLPLR